MSMEMAPAPVDLTASNSFSPVNETFDSVEFHDQSKEEVSVSTEPPKIESALAAAVPALIPSLKGLMTYSGGIVTCKGKWAMSDQAHEIDGQTSDFEFRLVKADADSGFFPINGKYQGWFLIKQQQKAALKVEDKDMMMKFVSVGEGTFSIAGQGHNRLGKFNLRGTLTNDGSVHIYREYYQLNTVPAQQQKKPPAPRRESIDKKKDHPEPEPVTPREVAPRIRKQSSLLKEFHDPLQRVTVPRSASKDGGIKRAASTVSHVSHVTERGHRLNPALKKCMDLLKELSKMPQSQWFLEPVDPVKFNIPDYPKIIKHPMDFSTIRKNIEGGVYDSIHGFAEDMRLVFRNAITYNQAKDSLVNIAAREVSNKFEDKFRALVTSLDPDTMVFADNIPLSKGIKRSKSRDFGISKSVKLPPGPRNYGNQFGLPPAAVDGSTMKIIEMQQMIATMQDELRQLRTVVKESEISKRLDVAKEAAQNPLTFDEKKLLVSQIHKLPEDKIERVLAIIQEAMPQCGEGTVEIPIDSLDTLTLRKLQSFVQANTVEKKRRSTGGNGANKRPRKTRTPKGGPPMEGGDILANQDELNLFDNQDDDLLFEPDSLEDMRDEVDHRQGEDEDPDAYARQVLAEYEKLKGNNNVFADENGMIDSHLSYADSPHDGVTTAGNDGEEEDDDNLWTEAAEEVHNKKQIPDDMYAV